MWIENNDFVPDDIYQIKNGKIILPFNNYSNQPMQIKTPNFTAIERIKKISEEQIKLTQQSGNEGINNIITKT